MSACDPASTDNEALVNLHDAVARGGMACPRFILDGNIHFSFWMLQMIVKNLRASGDNACAFL